MIPLRPIPRAGLMAGRLYYALESSDYGRRTEMLRPTILVGCSSVRGNESREWRLLWWRNFDWQDLERVEIETEECVLLDAEHRRHLGLECLSYLKVGTSWLRLVSAERDMGGCDRFAVGDGQLIMRRTDHRAWSIGFSGQRGYLVDELWTCARPMGIRGWAWAVLDGVGDPERTAVISSGRCETGSDALRKLVDALASSAHARAALIREGLLVV
jgi:hypothetical protein